MPRQIDTALFIALESVSITFPKERSVSISGVNKSIQKGQDWGFLYSPENFKISLGFKSAGAERLECDIHWRKLIICQ